VERMSDVVVIGAGVAGLAAAGELAHAGLGVTLVEARERMGGRIHTLDPEGAGSPVELGAEFIHGRPRELLGCLADAKTQLEEVTGETACFADGVLSACAEDGGFELLEELPAVVEREGDMSFAEFLARRKADPADAAQARAYVEGFNAADAERIGIAALARQQQAEDEIDARGAGGGEDCAARAGDLDRVARRPGGGANRIGGGADDRGGACSDHAAIGGTAGAGGHICA
jgi:monoamine oxidase